MKLCLNLKLQSLRQEVTTFTHDFNRSRADTSRDAFRHQSQNETGKRFNKQFNAHDIVPRLGDERVRRELER